MRSVLPAFILAMTSAASAQVTLNATMTADNAFTASISTNPDDAGDAFLTGTNWTQTFNGSVVLPGPGTYYLNVFAQDFGPPMMLIGLFTLDNPGASFSNGQQQLLTNTVDWSVSSVGFADAEVVPADLGANGTSPWGNFAAMGPEARFIWHPNQPSAAYFTTVITVVPAPAVAASLAGLGLFAVRRRR